MNLDQFQRIPKEQQLLWLFQRWETVSLRLNGLALSCEELAHRVKILEEQSQAQE